MLSVFLNQGQKSILFFTVTTPPTEKSCDGDRNQITLIYRQNQFISRMLST